MIHRKTRKCLNKIWDILLVVSLDEVVEDHKEEEEDADDVGEHGELDVCDNRYDCL